MNKDENLLILEKSKFQLDEMTLKLNKLLVKDTSPQFIPHAVVNTLNENRYSSNVQTKPRFSQLDFAPRENLLPKQTQDMSFEHLMNMLTLQREKQKLELRMYESKIDQQNLEIASLERRSRDLGLEKTKKAKK